MPSYRSPVSWTKQAKADIKEITEFYVDNADRAIAVRNVATIISKTKHLAANPMVGNQIEGLDERYRFWYAIDSKYRIYFKRTRKTNIKVLRVHSSRSRPLEIREIIE